MNIEIDGWKIKSEADFHRALSHALGLSGYYGRNLDALWDVMTVDVERPVHLLWHNSRVSKTAMPEKFDAIVRILRAVEAQDVEFGRPDRFVLTLQ